MSRLGTMKRPGTMSRIGTMMSRLSPRAREVAALLAILALAAILRLPALDQRGAWDADQGTDMLVLDGLVTRGEVPLLGPKTSIGTFHHGAAYYYLLAPAAALTGADPVAVTGEIALLGIGAVGVAWWLGRLVGGPAAGVAAAFLAALSPAGIDESTFIWNPNPIPLASGIAFAAALQAWRTGQARWWLLSAAGAMLTMQLHVLGIVALPPLAAVFLADLRRRRIAAADTGALLRAGAGAAAIIVAGYAPLAIHELTNDFSETRAILAYIGGTGTTAAGGVLQRVSLVGLRSVTWPLAGLITDRPVASLVAVALAAMLAGMAVLAGRRSERWAAGWLVGSLGWSVLALAVFAPSLAVITPGLPNDHYHAFLDPLVLVLAGAGLARLAAGALRLPGFARQATAPRAAAMVVLVLLAIVAVEAWPPAVSPDGGWRLVDQAAGRVAGDVGTSMVSLDGIPPFKSANALRFPLLRHGVPLLPPAHVPDGSSVNGIGSVAVLVCDPLFDAVVGAPCGGPVEDAWLAGPGRANLRLVERFDAGSRRVVSVYAVGVP